MHRLIRSRRLGRACAVPALLLLLAACGGSGGGEEPADAAASTQESSAPADGGSGQTEAGSEEDGDEAQPGDAALDEQTILPAMKSAISDEESAKFRMTMEGGGQAIEASGELALHENSQDMAMTMDGSAMGTGDMDIRVVDRQLYLSIPPMTPKGKFVRIRPGDQDSPLGGMGQLGPDPQDTFKAFEKGLRDVEYVGEESVDGEELDHYELTVDFRAAAKAQGLPRSPGAPKQIVYDMWLDDADLMRRIEMGVMDQMSIVMEMYDWGAPVSIQKPKPSDIVKMPTGPRGPAGS